MSDTERKGLSADAYTQLPDGQKYEPYVSASAYPSEFTAKAVGAGIVFGILFGAANAYLGLRVGLTISTSIPVAVLTIALFRALSAAGIGSTILEANLSQTVGSASSSLASGLIFTVPALFLWGLSPDLLQITLLALCGGLLGVLFMIPLRRYLIAGEHGKLPYPEGTACAEVLVAAETGGGKAKNVFLGLGVGAAMKALFELAHLLPGKVALKIPFIKKAEISSEMSSALLGVGFILGPRIAAVMVGGGLLSSLIIIPVIAYLGDGWTAPLYPETINLIRDMEPSQLWTRYVRYIGAGAVAMAGIITLVKSLPTMIESFRLGAAQIRERLGANDAIKTLRTEFDLPLKVVGYGAVIVALVLTFFPQAFNIDSMAFRAVAAVCVVVFAFFFVTVSSRIVGLVGVTSNPTSGMTIATLLGTAGIFLLLGWTDMTGKAAALTVGTVVAIAASIAGDTSQDLKTGFLLGATPRSQQKGEIIGVLASAIFISGTLLLIGDAWGFGNEAIPAPQATLMKLVIEGVLDSNLPWGLVAIGMGISIVVELFKLPSLAFAVGVYLPVATMFPVFLGGLLRLFTEKKAKDTGDIDERRERGILFGSGLVGGEGLFMVVIAIIAAVTSQAPKGWGYGWAGDFAPALAALVFAGLMFYFWRLANTSTDK
ncbi:MAG: oligopeptide transporter, OPT family [Bacteroidetes Order II. Incertae sedis bacterium]|nr:oligopeptide transporter, OPT family [Bacteroidetes Order II. bacterium]MBT5250406.1 oligopeptide transporter, OPT family [Bacteroidetes Order II. bacterium]MBT6201939.1 oligopeptide transporter, OPT family [Bacteroidetes Order II. bacterium]MBT6425826.1 oligopeptide transporter, OPT family [Bacteroidetes Order II. bacterium]MBT6599894.1 oligopeptide transporter, OPT family [Bacteroidetes Order II. bacterium]